MPKKKKLLHFNFSRNVGGFLLQSGAMDDLFDLVALKAEIAFLKKSRTTS